MLNWEFGFPADLFLHDTKYINPKQVLSFYQLSEQSQQVKSDSVSLSCYDLENFLSCILCWMTLQVSYKQNLENAPNEV